MIVELKEIESMKERAAVASAYWLDCSPHEHTEEDGLVMAIYIRKVMPVMERLLTMLSEKQEEIRLLQNEVERLNGLIEEVVNLAQKSVPISQIESDKGLE
ncbi:hypothetical protein NYE48_28055 [Paenibacillus sp. FSL M7-1455]|uniref:hypothetical protein n=1 Tax=Paenibacillus sp. FSL M7-1455 TaxID=2975316 RepID=UPI0030F6A098